MVGLYIYRKHGPNCFVVCEHVQYVVGTSCTVSVFIHVNV